MRPTVYPNRLILAGGDLLVLILVTLTGFARHGEIGALARMPSTLVPLIVGWGLAAWGVGLYDPDRAGDLRQSWRPLMAALLGVPLTGLLRGLWLNEPVDPEFVLVLTSVTALPMLVWRGLWAWGLRRKASYG